MNRGKRNKEKRKHCGSLMPNIYFLLQIIIVLLALIIVIQLETVFGYPSSFVVFSVILSLAVIVYFIFTRKSTITRQKEHC